MESPATSTPTRGDLTVGDLMTGDLISLRPVDTVTAARKFLAGAGLHALPVLDRGAAVGIVTLADCENRQIDECLGDVMTAPPVEIAASAPVADAATLMRSEYIHHLVVTDGTAPDAIGILSSFDLLAVIAD